MAEPVIHEGGCLCGRVRWRATGAPFSVELCHCAMCRRATGGVLVAWAGFKASRFRRTRGEPVYYQSSSEVRRGFCGACGSSLTYESEDDPGEVYVAVGSFDQPDALAPDRHIFWADRLRWLELADALPRDPGFMTEPR